MGLIYFLVLPKTRSEYDNYCQDDHEEGYTAVCQKITVFCDSGEISVTYQPVHFGHSKDIQYTWLNEQERHRIAN